MTFLNEKLYENVIQKYAPISDELKIISGYSSATFLLKVLRDYPHLKIELYLGMTPHGIAKKNHVGYQEIVAANQNVKVYYQINQPVTHTKQYTWVGGDAYINHIGSANFTENGFINWRETLVETDENLTYVYKEQIERSLSCDHDEIEKYIEIYEDEEGSMEDIREIIEDDIKISEKVPKVNEQLNTRLQQKQRHQHKFRQRIDKNLYQTFEIPIVFATDNQWSTRGINAWNRGDCSPYLMQSNNAPFSKVFPATEVFQIETDDGEYFLGQVNELHQKRLYPNRNIYEYLANRIGLVEVRPISIEDLIGYGRTHITVHKVSDKEYLFDFSSKLH